MASPAEHDLALAEADGSKEKAQVFGILRMQEEKASVVVGDHKASTSSSALRASDGRWQAPIFALARKASETFSGSIHVLPKVPEHRSASLVEDEWTAKGIHVYHHHHHGCSSS